MELCRAVQPDGGGQRCIRFDGHEGPHQTFVAEWSNGDSASRRRQPAHAKSAQAAYPNRPQEGKSRRQQQSRSGKSQQQSQMQGRGRRSRNRKKH